MLSISFVYASCIYIITKFGGTVAPLNLLIPFNIWLTNCCIYISLSHNSAHKEASIKHALVIIDTKAEQNIAVYIAH